MDKGQRLVNALVRIDYLPACDLEASSFEWMFENEKLVSFFDLFCDSVEAGNFLTDEENEEFKELESSSDSVLVGEELEKALHCLDTYEENSSESLDEEIQTLMKELIVVDLYADKLVHQRNALCFHETQLHLHASYLDELADQLEKSNNCLETDENILNKKVERCFSAMNKTVQNFVLLFQQDSYFMNKNSLGEYPVNINLRSYQASEHLVLEHLKSYIHLHFDQTLSKLSEKECDKNNYKQLNSSCDSLEEVINGTKDVDFHREIDRIRNALKISEEARLKSLVAFSLAEGEIDYYRAKSQHGALSCLPNSTLELTYEMEKSRANLNNIYCEIIELKQSITSKMIQWCNQYQNSFVLLESYEEKLRCQEYFLAKQQEVLNFLIHQHARQVLIYVALNIKKIQLQNIYSILHEFERNINDDWNSFSGRQTWMHCLKKQDTFQEISNDIVTSLSTVLGNQIQSTVLYLTNSALSDFCQQIQTENTFLLSSLLNMTTEQTHQLFKAEMDLKTLEQATVDCGDEAQIMCSTFDHKNLICEAVRKLDSNTRTLEQSLLSSFKEISTAKKLISGNTLQLQLRKIFVYFFLKPHKLKEKVHSLQADIEGEKLLNV